jgi:hypothetical protein
VPGWRAIGVGPFLCDDQSGALSPSACLPTVSRKERAAPKCVCYQCTRMHTNLVTYACHVTLAVFYVGWRTLGRLHRHGACGAGHAGLQCPHTRHALSHVLLPGCQLPCRAPCMQDLMVKMSPPCTLPRKCVHRLASHRLLLGSTAGNTVPRKHIHSLASHRLLFHMQQSARLFAP